MELIGRADALAAAGKLIAAERAYLEAVRHMPREPGALRRLSAVQANLSKFPDALRHIERAVKLSPRDARLHLAMAWIAVQAGDSDRALEAYTRASYFDPDNAEARLGIAAVHERRHDLERAEAGVDELLAENPDATQPASIKARLLRRRGEYEQAAALLERISRNPLPPDEACAVLFELGRVRDKQGEYDAAFDAFTRANAEQATLPQSRKWDAEQPFRLMHEFSRITPEQFERWREWTPPGDGDPPLFLVGMPRSGTTMTEQILASHPAIQGSGEKPLLNNTRRRLGKMFELDRQIDRLDALGHDQILELRALYRQSLDAELKGTGKRLVLDKLPLQIMSLPLISRLFPDARVIVALRDPRDACLSCFFQEFSPNNSMVNFFDLARTARFYDAVIGMYLAQREHYAFETLEVKYEDTTADLEPQARRILEFAGLEWDENVLAFHERRPEKFVNTPSYEAVSEPVHRKAIARWRNYERHLEPIMPVLEKYVQEFGYGSSPA